MPRLGDSYRRYLRLLGCRAAPSGPDGLADIVRRHLCKIPFENVSKLVRRRAPSLDEFLDGIEYQDLGGTCYTSNPFLWQLLKALGYDADLLGADMNTPNVHTSIRVRIPPHSYHVDVGYAAPLYEPIRLDRLPHAVRLGDVTYVLHRSGEGHEMLALAGGERVHRYFVHDVPRTPEFFAETVLDSYNTGKTFMTQLRITRFFDDHAAELRDTTLLVFHGTTTLRTRLATLPELKAAVADRLGMPRCPIERAVAALEETTGRDFFDVAD